MNVESGHMVIIIYIIWLGRKRVVLQGADGIFISVLGGSTIF